MRLATTDSFIWLALLLLVSLAEAEVLIDTDFGGSDRPVDLVSADGRTNVTGALPAGWFENSTGSWQPDIELRYQKQTEGARGFLRFEKVRGGTMQVGHSLPQMKERAFLRLVFTARSTNGGSAQLGIRFDGAPYSFPWNVSPNTGLDWRDYRYEFWLDPQPQSVRLQLTMGAVGAVDLTTLRLERLSRDELIAAIKAEHPNASLGNLARLTRFPLGLPTGWCLSREDDDAQVVVSTDPDVPGPSGYPALHVRAPGSFRLSTAPFPVPWSFEKHTASLSLRGNCSGRLLAIGAAGRGLGEQRFQLQGEAWQRVSVTFDPVLRGEVHGLRIESGGELWLDALQVERGTAATPYTPPMPCEVALACPPSEASAARVQFENEPAEVLFAVTGEANGAVLRARVADLYGEAKDFPPKRLDDQRLQTGTLDYAGSLQRSYGAFRVEAWVEDSNGRALSAPSEVVLYRLRRPRHWGKDAPDSPFGVHTLPATRHLMMAKAVGCNWVRLHDAGMEFVGWSWVEPEKGKWTFFDEPVQRYRRWHLSVLGQLETAPNWATGYPKPCQGYWDRWYQPQNLDDWSEYVRRITGRYKGVIHAWEVWNEPWGSFWAKYAPGEKEDRKRSDTAAEDYAALQAAAYQTAKDVDSTLTVVGFNSYAGYNGREWTAGVQQAGGLATCDVFSYHRYADESLGWPGDGLAEHGLREATDPIRDASGKLPKPVWMSEGTTLRTSTFDGFYNHTLPYPNEDDYLTTADQTARYVVRTLSDGARKLFLYTMHGLDCFRGTDAPNWRALLSNDGYLHPAAAAHSALAWLLEGTDYRRTVQLADGVCGYAFEGNGQSVLAVSTKPGHAPWRLPEAQDVRSLDLFGNPLASGTAVGERMVYVTADRPVAELVEACGGRAMR
jgi:hypothetical protein